METKKKMRISEIHGWWSASASGFPSNVYPLVVILGQSNADGQGERNRMLGLTSYSATPPGKIFYKPNQTVFTDDGAWQDIVVGTNNVNPAVEGSYDTFGAEVSWVTKLNEFFGKTVYVIKCAEGATFLEPQGGSRDWHPTSVDEKFVVAFANFYSRGVSILADQGIQVKVVGVEFHQGENDATDATARTNRLANLTAFWTAVRLHCPLLASVPAFIPYIYYATGANEDTINAATDSYVLTDANAYSFNVASQVTSPRKQDLPAGVKSTYPPSTGVDDTHNSYEFQIKKGELYYNKQVEIGVLGSYSALGDSYSYDLSRAVDVNTKNSFTALSGTCLTKIDALITEIKSISSGALWKKINGLHVFAQDGSANFGRINLKNPAWKLGVLNGSPSWVSNQGLGPLNGTSQYFDANFVYGTLVAGTFYNNLSMFELVHTMTSRPAFGLQALGGNNDFYYHNIGGSSSIRCWNTTPTSPISGLTTSTKFMGLSRSASTDYDYYVDGVATNVALARVGSANITAKFGYSGSLFGTEQLSICIHGQGVTQAEGLALRTACVNYKASL